jgi:hypothetical protein
MTRTVLEVQHLIRRRLGELRAMERFLGTIRFEEAIAAATDEQLKRLELILKSDSSKDLKAWAKSVLCKSLQDMTMRELFSIARDKMVPKYSRLSRDRLIKALEKHGNATSMG